MNRLASVVAVLALLASTVFAQVTTSRLDGSVKDPNGAVIQGAAITLINSETGATKTATSNESGAFVFANVSVGLYRVKVEAEGFKQLIVGGVKVDVGVPTSVNFTVEVGEVTEIVEVTASEGQAVINTVNAELNTVITRRQILDLPLNGRNPLQLAGLQAGVTTNSSTRNASVNGLRGSYNNLTQDGINIQDNLVRTGGFFGITAPSVENVAEFSITTQNIGPDAGIGVAQVKLITPSGSNEYHGSIFEFHRNTALDANTFFNNSLGIEREKLIRNQSGGRVGGPIFRDKLFFFAYYQGTRERSGDTQLRTVLTDSARQGLFSYRRTDNGELETVNVLDLGGMTIDPFTANLISLTPGPNDPTVGDVFNTQGFRFNSSVIDDDDLFGFRVDFQPSANHQFEAVFQHVDSRFPNDVFNGIGETFPGIAGGGQESIRQLGSYAWRWTPASTITNELRWGFQRAPVGFTNSQKFAEGFRLTVPLVSDPIQTFLPQGRNTPVYELIDNASWVKGDHSIRFGGNFRWVSSALFNDAGIIPLFNLGFGGANSNPLTESLFPGGIASEDFSRATSLLALLGAPVESGAQTFNVTSRTSGFVSGAGEDRILEQRFLSLYVGDTWRWKPNFTLNLGLRWEWHMVPDEANGLALLPVGGLEALRDPDAVLDFAGGNTGRDFFNNDLNNFAPSISFAWDPFGGGKTSIRAGYSISYVVDSNFTAVRNAFRANDGLQVGVTNFNLPGTVSGGGIQPLPVPEFKVPRTAIDNIEVSPFNGLYTVNPNFRTPYVQQWSLSIERQILHDTAVEIRYVGNRGTKLARAIDLNQVEMINNGFVDDVLRAQQNMLNCSGNPNPRRASQCDGGFEPLALQIFPLLAFRGRTVLNNGNVQNDIRQGEAGDVVFFLLQNRNLVFDPRSGAQIGVDFFFPNPNALFTDFLGNNSWSTHHSLQVEVRRRFSNGLYFQANYTWGKSLTDFQGSQANFDAFMDINRPELEKRRPSFDVTHTFNLNFVYELPFGPGQQFFGGAHSVWGKLLEGWQFNGIVQARSGGPITLLSTRNTFNRTGRNDINTVFTSLTIPELRRKSGLFRQPDGTINVFSSDLIGPDGRGNPDFFQNPNAGEVGALGLTPVSGPSFFNTDFSILKRTKLTETTNVEFRAEFFNIFNNVNFFNVFSENINSVNFGKVTDTFSPRIMQFALKFNF